MPASVSCLGDLGALGVLGVEMLLASVLVSRSLLLSRSPEECESDVDSAGLVVRARSSVVEVAVAPLLVDASDVLCAWAGRFSLRPWDCTSESEVVDGCICEGVEYDI